MNQKAIQSQIMKYNNHKTSQINNKTMKVSLIKIMKINKIMKKMKIMKIMKTRNIKITKFKIIYYLFN